MTFRIQEFAYCHKHTRFTSIVLRFMLSIIVLYEASELNFLEHWRPHVAIWVYYHLLVFLAFLAFKDLGVK